MKVPIDILDMTTSEQMRLMKLLSEGLTTADNKKMLRLIRRIIKDYNSSRMEEYRLVRKWASWEVKK